MTRLFLLKTRFSKGEARQLGKQSFRKVKLDSLKDRMWV